MRYLINDFDRDEFDTINTLVQVVHSPGSVVPPFQKLRSIHYTPDILLDYQREYIEKEAEDGYEVQAVCSIADSNRHEFDICLNESSPSINPKTNYYRQILIHELCHGYVGPGAGHFKTWRSHYCRTLLHYDQLIKPVQNLNWLIRQTLRRYAVKSSDRDVEELYDRAGDEFLTVADRFNQIQEKRKTGECPEYTSISIPTPAYWTSRPRIPEKASKWI